MTQVIRLQVRTHVKYLKSLNTLKLQQVFLLYLACFAILGFLPSSLFLLLNALSRNLIKHEGSSTGFCSSTPHTLRLMQFCYQNYDILRDNDA